MWAIYNGLKNTPPKDFPTAGEIRTTISSVLPILRPHLEEYERVMERVRDLSIVVDEGSKSEDEVKNITEEINRDFKKYGAEHGDDLIEVQVDKEFVKTLSGQFLRPGWGNRWFGKIDEFAEFDELLTSLKGDD